MSKYSLTKMAVDMFCPGNAVRLDDLGLPSLMVYIPKFKNSDVLASGDDNTHPAFIVNGVEIAGFYYSKYQNIVRADCAYSLPGEGAAVSVDFESAYRYCEEKGYGWHMSTAAEWAAIALWCKKNGWLPYGNNSNGKDTREDAFKAIPVLFDDNTQTGRVANGTGPLTWSHNKTTSGIWDLNGNVWEWQGGLRLVYGELQILASNDAADSDNPQNPTSVLWKAIKASDGSLVEPENNTAEEPATLSGSTVRLDYINDVWTYSTSVASTENADRSCLFGNVACNDAISNAAKNLLRTLALLPDEGAVPEDYEEAAISLNNTVALQYISRGGCRDSGSKSGIFAICGREPTSDDARFGFRAAYIAYLGR